MQSCVVFGGLLCFKQISSARPHTSVVINGFIWQCFFLVFFDFTSQSKAKNPFTVLYLLCFLLCQTGSFPFSVVFILFCNSCSLWQARDMPVSVWQVLHKCCRMSSLELLPSLCRPFRCNLFFSFLFLLLLWAVKVRESAAVRAVWLTRWEFPSLCYSCLIKKIQQFFFFLPQRVDAVCWFPVDNMRKW